MKELEGFLITGWMVKQELVRAKSEKNNRPASYLISESPGENWGEMKKEKKRENLGFLSQKTSPEANQNLLQRKDSVSSETVFLLLLLSF